MKKTLHTKLSEMVERATKLTGRALKHSIQNGVFYLKDDTRQPELALTLDEELSVQVVHGRCPEFGINLADLEVIGEALDAERGQAAPPILTVTPEQFEEAQSEILSDVRPHLNQLSDSMECAESCETGADLLHNLTQAEESCAQALRALREVLRGLKGNTRRSER